MSDLQDFGFDQSHYERINQKWVCANKINGHPCAQGPDAKGKCYTRAECTPYKNGDRWECTRSAFHGGKCEHGPQGNGSCSRAIPPCKPIRSHRAKRGLVVSGFTLLCLLLVLGLSFSPARDQFINPGALSAKHSAKVQACDSCHPKDSTSTVNWLSLAVKGEHESVSSACVNCHKFDSNALDPHNLDKVSLSNIGNAIKTKSQGNPIRHFNLFSSLEDGIQCYFCHEEHQGKSAKLTQTTNNRCIHCHTNQQSDFASEHSDFNNFAHDRRTRLRFNHSKHFDEYFIDEEVAEFAPASCMGCHEVNKDSGTMASKSFKTSCIRCHKKDTTAEGFIDKGIVFFRLPALDLTTLQEHNIQIGQWPESLEDEELTPLMLLLLSANPELQPVLERIISGDLSLIELENESEQTLRLVGKLAWGVKDLFLEMLTNKNKNWISAIETLSSQRLDDMSRSIAKNFIPKQLLNKATSIWMPNLSIENVIRQTGKKIKTNLVSVDLERLQTDMDLVRPGRWYVQNYALAYRPKGHNDDVYRFWAELAITARNQNNAFAAPLLSHLSSKDTAGQCMRCHSIDKVDAKLSINWRTRSTPPQSRVLTVFSHNPHMKVINQKECDTCHKLDTQADYDSGFEDYDPFGFQSNFMAIGKNTCAQCHNSNKVGDTCVTCHKYHFAGSSQNKTKAAVRLSLRESR
jgi:hypothetical protein